MTTDLVGQVVIVLTDYLTREGWKDKVSFKLRLAKNVAELMNQDQLTIKNLQNAVPANDPFFVANGVSRKRFTEEVFPYLKEIIPINKREIEDKLDEFFKELYYQLPRDHYKTIWNNGNPDEAIVRTLVQNSLVWFCKNEGFVYPEVNSGAGRIDIVVASRVEIVVEIKTSKSYKSKVGIKQLSDYVNDRPGRRGYYVLFDFTKPHKYKELCDLGNNRFSYHRNPKMLVIQCARVKPSTQKY